MVALQRVIGDLRGSRFTFLLLAAMVGSCGALLLAGGASAVGSPVMAGVAVVGLALAAGMLLSPKFAVLVLAFSIPFERIGRLTNDSDAVAISASRILGVIVLGSLVLGVAVGRQRLRFNLPIFLFAVYTAIALLSVSWSSVPADARQDAIRIAGNLLFFFLIVSIIRDYASVKQLIFIWLVASLLAAAYSLTDYYLAFGGITSEQEMGLTSQRGATVVSDLSELRSLGVEVRRLFGPTAHPTLFGLNNLMTLPFLVWAFRTYKGKLRFVWLAAVPVVIYCMLLSNTRAVLLVAVLGALFMLIRGLIPFNSRILVATLVTGLALAPLIPEDVYRRTLDPKMYTTSSGDSLRVRFKLWDKSWVLIQQNWLTGIGVGDRETLLKMVTDEKTGYLSTEGLRASAHNEFIWVLAEVGVVGYLFFWGFVAWVTGALFRAGSLFLGDPEGREAYLLAVAGQTLMAIILVFSTQSEAFHYPLKGWWMTAAIGVTLLEVAKRRGRELLDRQSGPEQPVEYRAG